MATGAVTAREPKVDAKTETTETSEAQPLTLKQRFVHLLHEIFKGREEHLGWHQ
jgi:hypothetical protein